MKNRVRKMSEPAQPGRSWRLRNLLVLAALVGGIAVLRWRGSGEKDQTKDAAAAPGATSKEWYYREPGGAHFPVDTKLTEDRILIKSRRHAIAKLESRQANLAQKIQDERATLNRSDRSAVERFDQLLKEQSELGERIQIEIKETHALIDAHNNMLKKIGRNELMEK